MLQASTISRWSQHVTCSASEMRFCQPAVMARCSARTLMDGRCCHTRTHAHTHAYTRTRTRQPSVQARVAAQPGKRLLGDGGRMAVFHQRRSTLTCSLR